MAHSTQGFSERRGETEKNPDPFRKTEVHPAMKKGLLPVGEAGLNSQVSIRRYQRRSLGRLPFIRQFNSREQGVGLPGGVLQC